ncbi:hypothetical protein [Halalkalibacter alkalisediminis]|uniref:Aminoglycoside phosphotransferase domain-containing protein n=1 Tax=Halalkalibacter alkalisediminis TaxID=935616 RepID=A0ABV6NHD5_9BACI|nr:hypothetical protein [Halalkalibacter alkalisediminis]
MKNIKGKIIKAVILIFTTKKYKGYRYIKVNNYFYSLDTNKYKMFFYLWSKLKPFSIIDGKSTNKKLIPEWFVKLYRICHLITNIHREPRINKANLIVLPVYGQIAIYSKRQDNFKVFDVKKGIATTIFSDSIKNDILTNKVEKYKKLGELSLGPQLIEFNKTKKMYKEAFLNYPHFSLKTMSEEDKAIVIKKVTSFIKDLITKYPVEHILLDVYLHKLKVESTGKLLGDNCKIREINDFISDMKKDLLLRGNEKIYLVMSHGDLHFNNLIKDKKVIKAIDWEFCEKRSILYDLHFLRYKTKSTVDIPFFIKLLHKENVINASTIDSDLYLDLFYLEYITHWLNVVYQSKEYLNLADINNILNWIIRDIKVFKSFKKNKGIKTLLL